MWPVTRKLIQSRTEAQLSAENPFSGRMESPGHLRGNLFHCRTDTQPGAKSHSLRMKDVSVGCAILTWFLDVFLSWLDISVE